ncbi:MAG TPA: SIMPL domain-containing protein [Patescibacteria group bacterium]|nr:SIMPL domain-containing protein [Patescibacteria group bacterium]
MQLTSEAKLALKTALLAAIFTVILLMLVNYFFNHSLNLFSNNSKDQPFTVQGTATVNATPDLADVSFTVNKTATSLQDAQNQANTSTNKIVADLQTLGIAKKDIKTSDYNSSPNYANSDNSQSAAIMLPIRPGQNSETIISYTVSENVDIQVHDNSKVNNVIDAITKDGAENVSGPNYVFSDGTQQKLQDEARTQAINNAKQKAESLAKAAGINLGKITNISEGNNGIYAVQPLMMKTQAAGVTNSAAVTNINPGQNSVTDNVTLSYETW